MTVCLSTLIVNIAAYLVGIFNILQPYIANQIYLNLSYKFQLQVLAQFLKNVHGNVDMDLEDGDEDYTKSFYFSTSAVILSDLRTNILGASEKL